MPENKLTLDNLAERFQLLKTAFDCFYHMDPSMIWALRLEQTVEEGLVPYRNIFREMKKQKSQAEIMMYFHKVTPSVPVSPAAPCISSTSCTSATPETASPTPPLPPPPQPAQHESDKDEDLYDNPLPFNE